MHEHILVVDDCEDVRFLLTLKLNNLGYDVIEAVDGEDALEVLSEDDEIDIILMDIMMPNISGLELLKILNKLKRNKEMKIICITANMDESVETEVKSLGADGLLAKPIKGDELRDKLNIILKHAV